MLHDGAGWAKWMCAAQLCPFTAQGLAMDSHTLGWPEFVHCAVQVSGAGAVPSVTAEGESGSTSLHKHWEVQKLPGELWRREEQPTTGTGGQNFKFEALKEQLVPQKEKCTYCLSSCFSFSEMLEIVVLCSKKEACLSLWLTIGPGEGRAAGSEQKSGTAWGRVTCIQDLGLGARCGNRRIVQVDSAAEHVCVP